MSNMTGPGGANSAFDIRCDTREIARLQAEYKRTDDITKRLRENGTLRDEEAATEIERDRSRRPQPRARQMKKPPKKKFKVSGVWRTGIPQRMRRKPPPVDKGRPIPIPTDKSHTRRMEK